ncbi:putative C-type lectin domain family 20 member A [Puntigrus tetrazona]|uniref:putative C-type lectin domain family 20 member A n=1 Tax=Puntigrus tetrazona TaxID=1606681 RepID=UPI001C8AA3F7|nr:putative C-type lectin domain family 20 member A [Puntigrus tetrazona]
MAPKATITVLLFLNLFGLNNSIYRKHYFVNLWRKWPEAQKYCQDNYDDLSIVRNDELQQLSANLPIFWDFVWIGLSRDPQNPKNWKWTGGENATDVYWDRYEPSSFNEKCGAIKMYTAKVHDLNCDSDKTFYCMKLSKLIVVQQESTWEEALLYCRQNYKDLAVLSSEQSMVEAKDQSTTALTDDVWIGLRFIAGHWLWSNGETFEYKVWSSDGELQCPDMNQRCAVLNRNSMVWKPMDCEKKINFFCLSN